MFEDDPIELRRRGSQIRMGLEELGFLGLVVLSVIGEFVGNY